MPKSRNGVDDVIPGVLAGNSWDKAYWFARMLVNSDEYGGPGRDSAKMVQVAQTLRSLAAKSVDSQLEDELIEDALGAVTGVFLPGGVRPRVKTDRQREAFCEALRDEIETRRDVECFALVCEKFIVPMNYALGLIPDSDKIYAESVARTLLDRKGPDALAQVIELWDDLGRRGCIRAERDQVVDCFRTLRRYLADEVQPDDADVVLSAFAQEFERRLGQKRKGRAGRSLESLTSFVLTYFNIPPAPAPQHFTTGLEIDNWVRGRNGWLIGISCKRTLRERWKQAYTTDLDMLNRHRIQTLWHVVTYTRDLSDQKITEMGGYRAVVFVPSDSDLYRRAAHHPGLSKYVRPLESFIPSLRAHVKGEE